MKRMTIALINLSKSVVARPLKPFKVATKSLHWTKFDMPLDQMTDAERSAASERLADEMLEVIKKHKK